MRTICLAGVAGFEPAAYGFGDRCSTSLSYTPALSPPFNCTAPIGTGSIIPCVSLSSSSKWFPMQVLAMGFALSLPAASRDHAV